MQVIDPIDLRFTIMQAGVVQNNLHGGMQVIDPIDLWITIMQAGIVQNNLQGGCRLLIPSTCDSL